MSWMKTGNNFPVFAWRQAAYGLVRALGRGLSMLVMAALLAGLGIGVIPPAVARADPILPPNTPRQDFWETNGGVYAIVPAGNLIYIGGSFTHVGPYTGNGVPIAAATGVTLPAFPRVKGTIYAVAPDGSGGLWILRFTVSNLYFPFVKRNG